MRYRQYGPAALDLAPYAPVRRREAARGALRVWRKPFDQPQLRPAHRAIVERQRKVVHVLGLGAIRRRERKCVGIRALLDIGVCGGVAESVHGQRRRGRAGREIDRNRHRVVRRRVPERTRLRPHEHQRGLARQFGRRNGDGHHRRADNAGHLPCYHCVVSFL